MFLGLAEADDFDLGGGLLVAEFYDFDVVEGAFELLGAVRALALVLLDGGVDAGPAAVGVDAARGQVVDDVERDQVLLQLPAPDRLLAQRTRLVDTRPVLDANVAESMPNSSHQYPHAVLTGSSKTSWQMLHFKCLLMLSGERKSRLVLEL